MLVDITSAGHVHVLMQEGRRSSSSDTKLFSSRTPRHFSTWQNPPYQRPTRYWCTAPRAPITRIGARAQHRRAVAMR